MTELLLILISACLVNNLVLDHMLGTDPALAASRKIRTAFDLGLVMIFVMPLVAVTTYPVLYYLLIPLDLVYLQLLCFVLVSTAAVLFAEKALEKFKPVWHEKIAGLIWLILVNATVFGVVMLNVQHRYGLSGSLMFGIGSGLGFALVLAVLSPLQERLTVADVPAPFRGIAILLITLGLMSMAFMGFTGLTNL